MSSKPTRSAATLSLRPMTSCKGCTWSARICTHTLWTRLRCSTRTLRKPNILCRALSAPLEGGPAFSAERHYVGKVLDTSSSDSRFSALRLRKTLDGRLRFESISAVSPQFVLAIAGIVSLSRTRSVYSNPSFGRDDPGVNFDLQPGVVSLALSEEMPGIT